MGKAIEGAVKAAAKERQREAIKARDEKGRAIPTSGNFPEVDEEKTREKVASAVGMGRTAYEKAAAVVEAAKAERDENTCRKDFTPSEAVAMGQAIESAIAEEARKRKAQAPGKPQGAKKVSSSESDEEYKGRTDETVAAAVGMKKDKYREAAAVVEAAKAEPEKFGPLVEQMDATGKVHPAYVEMKAKQEEAKPSDRRNQLLAENEKVSSPPLWRRHRSGTPRISHNETIPAPILFTLVNSIHADTVRGMVRFQYRNSIVSKKTPETPKIRVQLPLVLRTRTRSDF